MKKKLRLLGFGLTGILAFSDASAQNVSRKFTKEDGTVKYLQFDNKGQSYSAEQSETAFSKFVYKTSFDKLVKFQSQKDALGLNHDRFQQYYKGYKLEFANFVLHSKAGVIESINGDFKHIKNADLTVNLTEDMALKAAISYVNAETYMWEGDNSYFPKGELVILNNTLTYKFDIYAETPVSRANIYVSANSGKVVFTNNIIKHAVNGTADTRYSGQKTIQTATATGGYTLKDNSRGNGIETYDMNEGTRYNNAVNFIDGDNNWSAAEWNNAAKDNAALDAHWGLQ